MSLYDDSKRKQKSVRLTSYQQQKLDHLCGLFGVSTQRFLSDAIDYAYLDYLEIVTGRVSLNQAIQNSMQKLMDDYIRLKKIKGLVPASHFGHFVHTAQERVAANPTISSGRI